MATTHNPTNFEPSDYVVEDYLDNKRPEYYGQSVEAYAADVKFWEQDMAAVLGADWRSKSHRCIHCGNSNVRWITAVRHLPTMEVVVFGSDCTDRLGFANNKAFKLALLQKKADGIKGRLKIYTARQAFLAANPAIAEAIERAKNPMHSRNSFVQDVLRKLDQFGSLSERQVAAVLSSLQRDEQAQERKAAEAVEPKGEAPSGRAVVTGSVLSVKERETDFGITLKMLVKLENNSKVWVTVPSGSGIERGDKVTVRATFTVSQDDKSFAFGSRPFLVSREAAQASA